MWSCATSGSASARPCASAPDWDTTEDIAVPHHGAANAAASFRYAGRPFTAKDWERIESSTGVLRPLTRATAWVCQDGKVLVDWAVPKEG